MPLSSTPCSCGGNNENCFKCWGTGMVEPTNGPVLERTGSGALPFKSPPVMRPRLACPICSAEVTRLGRHLRRMHRPPVMTVHPTPSASAPDTKRSAAGTSEGWNRQEVVLPAARVVKDSPAPASAGGSRCPICHATLPNNNQVMSHIVGSHGKKALRRLGLRLDVRTGKRTGVIPGWENGLDYVSKMDAADGWGAAFRDHGQFGSYPSFDGMDDESKS